MQFYVLLLSNALVLFGLDSAGKGKAGSKATLASDDSQIGRLRSGISKAKVVVNLANFS
ncbi:MULTISPECIES: hypothetical protein [Aerosakkonema]|uniref:hypothetical protein n=1 Tax=Aerosakkonema TaxID=1246629 RepID=UPI0035BBB5C9